MNIVIMNYTTDTLGENIESPIPVLQGLHDLTPDELLLSQEHYESEVRSYPRRLPVAIAKASGVLVEDSRGQTYLDCLAGAGTLTLGYNHPEINQALIEQLNAGIPYQTLDITTPAKDHFIRELMAFLPQDFSENTKVQFCGPSGADAVEAAIKLAKQTTGRNTIAAFHGAYHGMTNGTMAMMGNLGTKSRRQGLMADVHFLPFPYDLRCPFGLQGEQGARQGLRYIERMLADDESGVQKPAAIIVEPVQGEGGVIPAPAFWLQELRRITEENGILLIFDEIQCGIGKTGEHFAFEESGVKPDILCLSKAVGGGLPMSLLVFDKEIDTWLPGEHTGTFRGNQLAMVSGAKAMEIIRRDNLANKAKITGDYLRRGLEKIALTTSCIAEVRGKGLMLGVEICDPEGGKNKFGEPLSAPELTIAIQRAALERGLIIEKGGREGSVLRFLPPIIITFEQIDFALKALQDAIESLVEPTQAVQPADTLQQNWRDHFIHTGKDGAESFEAAMNATTQALKKIFENTESPYSGIDPTVLASQIRHANLGETPQSLDDVIEETSELIAKNSIIVQHPHCIAHLHTPPLIPAVAAEAFITALNQSMDSWDQASAATFVEQEVTDWLCQRFGFDEKADGVFTSGGTQSNLMGLLMARDNAIEKISGTDVQKDGLPDYADKLRVISSKNSHFTMQKSASLLGLGEHAVICVDTYSDGTMDIESADATLAALKAEGLIPFAITGTAGTTDHGAIDDLDDVAMLAKKHGLWMHVDAAYGGALMLSRHHARLEGIERADSLTIDFHKMFFQPISCGAVILKDKNHFGYIRHHADYLNREEDVLPNLVDKSIATTRRFDALKLWMTLQNVGPQALGSMVDHLLNQTQLVADMVNNRSQFELLAAPCLSTVLFRYVGVNQGLDLDYLNKQIRLDALVKGRAVVGETVVDGNVALKFTLLNPCLKLSDFDSLLNELESLADDAVKQVQG
ncbi:pyridoxal phosphate-dependent class III aminotransferase [Enterovibrio norvegicus]|uniref:Pyridoxal phosphate-dependent class III aminotransferase n=1 Tax=Enterovibrio norvegicus TaxID=188144 RepID=A0ABV4L6N1_9GAMM|nr:pyridoxal phosphate-dependent class III aminotransferase [Enterovibrio norvegicus]OEF58563.1 aminotransferase class III [Enterovibrio norvegicus]PMH72018.1 aminotransferase class III [Enterovibrio norvegicus]PMI26410.1 aminotransferase class III [Enterovibrio norvegicus]TKF33941.1 aminotransferase class III-fold pyridoxal phosphate-dependent enzyme [Enterovibrio norvegicus]